MTWALLSSPRFPSPLIEPDMRNYRIRLSGRLQGATSGYAVLQAMVGTPDNIEALKAELAAEHAVRLAAEAKVSSTDALIASLKLQIEKLRRELYGQRSKRDSATSRPDGA